MRTFIHVALSVVILAMPCLVFAQGHGDEHGSAEEGGLLQTLGIDPQAIIIQALGFLIVLLILWKYAFGRIGGMLDARRENIQGRMRQLEEDQQRLDRLNAETQQRLNRIQAEAQQKIREAVEEANQERERILDETRQEAAEELERARQRIQSERDAAILDLRATVAEIAMNAAGKILNAELDERRHRQLVDDFIAVMPNQASEQD